MHFMAFAGPVGVKARAAHNKEQAPRSLAGLPALGHQLTFSQPKQRVDYIEQVMALLKVEAGHSLEVCWEQWLVGGAPRAILGKPAAQQDVGLDLVQIL
jgi:hypothetical protein